MTAGLECHSQAQGPVGNTHEQEPSDTCETKMCASNYRGFGNCDREQTKYDNSFNINLFNDFFNPLENL